MNSYPNPQDIPNFSLLILDRNNVPKDTNLQEILKYNPAEYCIILNARRREIRSLCHQYWISAPIPIIHRTTSCMVLSRKGNPPHIILPPAFTNWEKLNDTSSGLYITIQGIKILLAYLHPNDPIERKVLLETLGDYQYIDNFIPDTHLLITYLDSTKTNLPKIEMSPHTWVPIEDQEYKKQYRKMSSFNFFASICNQYICFPEEICLISTKRQELSPSVGIITHVPTQGGWEKDYLNMCKEWSHLPTTNT